MPEPHDNYQCLFCEAVLDVPDGTEPLVSIEARGGGPNMHVIKVDGKEIHRCDMTVRRRR